MRDAAAQTLEEDLIVGATPTVPPKWSPRAKGETGYAMGATVRRRWQREHMPDPAPVLVAHAAAAAAEAWAQPQAAARACRIWQRSC